MFELSLDGCRARADRYLPMDAPTGVEVTFKINGISFRLAGTMRWLDAGQTAGIQFCPMPARRRQALEDLLDELEATKQAEEQARKHALEDGKPAEGSRPSHLRQAESERIHADILCMPTGGLRDEIRTVAVRPVSSRAMPVSALDAGCVESFAKPASPRLGDQPGDRDRREQTRHAVDSGATVYFIDVRAQISGRIVDLSISGCRIRTDTRFPVGIYRRVETEFKLDGMPFRLAGVVQALHDKFTVGIRFLDMSPRKREQLQELMQEIADMKAAENRE